MKLYLKEISLVAVVASAIGLLDGELFYLSLVRGAESFKAEGFNQISLLAPKQTNIASFIGVLSSLLSVRLFDLFNEQAVFGFYLLSLCLGAVFYFKALEKSSKNSVFSMILAILGIIGFVSSTKDLSIALAFLLSSLELFVLTDHRPKVRFFAIPLCFIHFGIDSSYLLSLAFYLLTLYSNLGLILGLFLLIKTALVVCEGYVISPYSASATFLVVILGLVLAIKEKRAKLICYSILTPFCFYLWGECVGQRFPAVTFFTPFIVAFIWSTISEAAKSNFLYTLKKLEQSFNFRMKNQFAFLFLCLAFVFFQTSSKFRHPINDAYLPVEAMDQLAESRPEHPPLHPLEIGGYVAFRLAPLLKSGQALNYFDMSAKNALLDPKNVSSLEFKKIWEGKNPELFNMLEAKSVLCQGGDQLCTQLKADDHWKILSHSSLGEKILQKFQNLPVKQKEIVSRRLEEESWYLYSKD